MEEERVEVLKQLYGERAASQVQRGIYRVSKDKDISENVRQQGNHGFNHVQPHTVWSHHEMLQYYTLSIRFAQSNSKELAFGYGNRSVALLHLGKFKSCIQDIDRALVITNDNTLKIKLLVRKIKCLHILNFAGIHQAFLKAQSILKEISDKVVKIQLQIEIDKAKIFTKQLYNIEAKTDNRLEMIKALNVNHVTNDFSNVEIKYNKKYGRHLVATKDFKPGDVIYLEEPYVRILNLDKLYAYCSHCYTTSWATIPCDKCGWKTYCSEKCKQEAWLKYHDVECSVYPNAKYISDRFESYAKQLAIKSLIFGLKEFGTVENLRNELEAFDKSSDHMKGFIQDGKIQTSGFKTIYSLSSNAGPQLNNLMEHIPCALKAIGMSTDYLGKDFKDDDIESYKYSEDVLFLGSLFLKLAKIGLVNSHHMWNYSNGCRMNLHPLDCWEKEDKCCSYGAYIAPVTGLLNHSCDPNAGRCYTSDHKVLLYALKPIMEGEQIFHSYIEPYYDVKREIRSKILSEKYNFQCNCTPCHLNWPHGNDLNTYTLKNMSEMDLHLMKHQFSNMEPISTSKDKTRFGRNIIDQASKDIVNVLYHLTPPSSNITWMLNDMRVLHEYLYGLYLDVIDKCLMNI